MSSPLVTMLKCRKVVFAVCCLLKMFVFSPELSSLFLTLLALVAADRLDTCLFFPNCQVCSPWCGAREVYGRLCSQWTQLVDGVVLVVWKL